ncbi:MAG: protein-L-isoaspartate O-methyltransferase [Rubellimicrobium sp.]|nr:protein-L-isoaspartate O-methyltransferase [Rubellimicrobium sp.]
MADYATRRTLMVDTQVRPQDVTRFPIIDAMLNVPRERFVPQALREAAYIGESLPLGPGRVLLEARTFAKMLEHLAIGPEDSVLHVAAGLGYGSAVMARMAQFVAALEDDADRARAAEAALSETGSDNVAVFRAPLDAGAPQAGPYDAILIEGGIEILPDAIAAQLKDGGRIAAVFMDGPLGEVRLGLMAGRRISWRGAFNATAPVLAGYARAAAFTL